MKSYVNDPRRCVGEVWGDGNSPRPSRCTRIGSLEHEGKWYCRQHHPPAVDARREQSLERLHRQSHIENEARDVAARRRQAEERYCEGISTEDLEAGRLKHGIVDGTIFWSEGL